MKLRLCDLVVKNYKFIIKECYKPDFLNLLDTLKKITFQVEQPIYYKYSWHGNVFFVFEVWASELDFKLHQDSDHLKEFRILNNHMIISKTEI